MEDTNREYKEIQKKALNDIERYNFILDYLGKDIDRAKANIDCLYSIQKEAFYGWNSSIYHDNLRKKHQDLLDKTNSILNKSVFDKN